MPVYDTYPAVDETNKFPAVIRQAMVDSTEFQTALATRVLKGDFGIHVKDYGVVGDGTTNDFANILTAANAAVAKKVPLVFDGTKRYAMTNTSIVNWPANLRIISNDCVFVKTTNTNLYAIRTSAGFRADSINLEMAGGGSADAGLYVNGSDTIIDRVKVTALTNNQAGANALLVGDISAVRTNIRINSIVLTGFQSPMRTLNVKNSRFSNGLIANFTTGVYVINTSDTVFDKFEVTGTSATASGGAGQNGMLMESQTADYNCSNVTFSNWLVDGAPEHSFRIGGALSCIDIFFDRCVSRSPGNATGNTATGGGAFKVLGAASHYHKNIHIINCSAEDSNTSASGTNNFSQFSLGYVDGATLINPIVRKRNNTYSAKIALFATAIKNVQVINPDFRDTQSFAVYLGTDTSNTTGDPVSDVKFTGGLVHSALTHAIELTPGTTTIKDLVFNDTHIIGNTTVVRGLRCNTVGSGGVYQDVFLGLSYDLYATLPGSGEPSLVTPAAGCMIRYVGPVYGYSITADNGSTMMDKTNGLFKIRKANAWVTV